MNTFGKILGGLWVVSFGAFLILSFIAESNLPRFAIEYRYQFRNLMSAFLKSPWFLVVFVTMWVFVAFRLAKKSGWVNLAEQYSQDYVAPAKSDFSRGSGYVGKVSYNGVLKVCASNLGIHLKIIFPFSFGHKPLFIPWREISAVVEEKALVPDNTPKFLRKIAEIFTRAKYKRIELVSHSEQRLIINWDKKFDDLSLPPN